jgi:hypothetical protein
MPTLFDDIEIETLLDSIGADIIEAAQRNLRVSRTIRGKKRNRYNTGTLSQNLMYTIKETPKTYTYKFAAKGPAEKYWKVIHDGRRKGATPPPIAPIEKWMKERKLRPRSKDGGFIKVKNIDSWRHYVAGKIARKIGKDGIEGVPYFKEAFESVWDKRKSEFKPLIDKIIKRTLDNKFKK